MSKLYCREANDGHARHTYIFVNFCFYVVALLVWKSVICLQNAPP
jgi:hypothetical protein